jgi:phosphoribosylformylglycinamidine synthase
MATKFGIVVFPGSNCDHDAYHVTRHVLGADVVWLWHSDTDLKGVGCVVLPGGFAYGDYLRCGAIARFSPIVPAVVDFARAGGLVIGICNGFQVLTECGLLPGALLKNNCLEFRCEWVNVRVENNRTPFTNRYQAGDVVRIPIAHGEGNFFADPATLDDLERNHRVVFRYCDEDGDSPFLVDGATPSFNPNGSVHNIAGVVGAGGNVLGMMPHPERASELAVGSADGLAVFASISDHLAFTRTELPTGSMSA